MCVFVLSFCVLLKWVVSVELFDCILLVFVGWYVYGCWCGCCVWLFFFVSFYDFFCCMKYCECIFCYCYLCEQFQWKLFVVDYVLEIIGLLQGLLMDGECILFLLVFNECLQCVLDQFNGDELLCELLCIVQVYIVYWLVQGWLECCLFEGVDQEQYELLIVVLQVICFVDGFEQVCVVVIESCLVLVIEQFLQLVVQIEFDLDVCLLVLCDECDWIDVEIVCVGVGCVIVLDGKCVLECVCQIIGLVDELIEDFCCVCDDFEQFNCEFCECIIDDEGECGDVLLQLFEGVDVIGESDVGCSFQVFWCLFNDVEQSVQFDVVLEVVLVCGFVCCLDCNECNFLCGFISIMFECGGQVYDVLQYFVCSLCGFVQSCGYLEQCCFNQLLKQVQFEVLVLCDEFFV